MKLEWNWKDFVVALVAGIVCAQLISGCDADPVEPVADPRELCRDESMEYVNFDGHEYVRYRSFHCNASLGGITHSPKCSCVVNK